MNIPNLKYYTCKNKLINLKTNNKRKKTITNTDSISQFDKKNKYIYRKRFHLIEPNSIYFSFNDVTNNSKKCIFNDYKVSPLIGLLIYEKSIKYLFEYIRKHLSKDIFIELKKKYILYVLEELHIADKNIINNLSDQDIIDLDLKLFVYQKSSYFLNYKNFIDRYRLKINSASNSLLESNKKKIKKRELYPFNSFNIETKSKNKSLINSSKILICPKNATKTIYNTEYNNKLDTDKTKTQKMSIKYYKDITKFNLSRNKKEEGIEHSKNISMANSYINSLIFIKKDNNKNSNINEKITNNDKNMEKISIKLPNKKSKKNSENIREENEKNKKILYNKNNNEKYSIKQLNLIKQNLDDNLKNMLNFSYGYFLNNEKESDSSKSLA